MPEDMEVSVDGCPLDKVEHQKIIIVDCKTPRQIHESMAILKKKNCKIKERKTNTTHLSRSFN